MIIMTDGGGCDDNNDKMVVALSLFRIFFRRHLLSPKARKVYWKWPYGGIVLSGFTDGFTGWIQNNSRGIFFCRLENITLPSTWSWLTRVDIPSVISYNWFIFLFLFWISVSLEILDFGEKGCTPLSGRLLNFYPAKGHPGWTLKVQKILSKKLWSFYPDTTCDGTY